MAVDKRIVRIEFEGADRVSPEAKKAQASVADLRGAIDSVKGALAAVGVTVGAGVFVNMVHDTLRATAALDDMAERTGSTVENLSALQRVAKVGGHDFDGFVDQMSRMIKGLKGADDEGQKAAYALNYLGIKAKDQQGHFRDGVLIVEELAEKLKKYGNSGNVAALVQDALGKGADRYIPLLRDLAEKTDRHATTTTAQAKAAEEAEKNLKRLQLVFEDSRRELVNNLTPALAEFTDKLLKAREASGSLAQGAFIVGADLLLGNPNQIEERIRQIDDALARISKNQDERQQSWAQSIGKRLGMVVSGTSESLLLAERKYLEAVRKSQMERGAKDPNSHLFEFAGHPAEDLGYQSLDERRLKPAQIAQKQEEAYEELKKQESEFTAYIAKQELERRDIRLKAIEEQRDLENMVQRARLYGTTDEDAANQNPAMAVQTARLQALRESFKTEEDLARESYNTQLATLQEFSDQELEAIGGRLDAEARLRARYNYDVLMSDRNRHAAQLQMELETVARFGELMQLLGAKNRAAALVAIGINKGLAVAQVIINTQAAIARGYAEMGPYAGTINAARMEALQAIQIGIIAATGLVEAAQSGRGGGGGGVSSAPSAGGARAPEAPVVTQATLPRQDHTTIIDFHGTTDERKLLRRFVELLNENSADGTRIIVRTGGH